MENKYQEALDWVSAGNDSCGTEWDLLQELVDKETPMKYVYQKYQIPRYSCPTCKESLREEYCGSCGQKIDWNDDNE